ncbi:BZ3500_MvSof-1268-A1-R1_Chr3-2g06252 [Microbotryum saponariae]|uniref:BZ3500_MvSof-1268-A1-R1_Chr3-2g06252 protein n=1 Tax=Microbotryum saponariae TaxID=289078 RepID=A0A2X0LXQ4_9BASI|nr:BZ3500_MvSof-1268-A1-R1_Chr3-2g06252 [Microbotryum saponariae]SDA04203.1 BZ3501_MvSof-1269-A2-R1_Chr3-2g05943 [Microbotryum saponariae]
MGFFSRSKKPKSGSNSTSNSSSPSPATASTGGNHASTSATTKLQSSTNPKVAGPRYTSSDEERSSSDSRAGAVHRRDSAALSTALPSSDTITEPRSKNSASNFSLEAAAASRFNPFKNRSNAASTLKGPSSTSLNTSTSSANLARDRYAEQRGCDLPLTESPGVTTSQSTDYLSSLGHSSSRPPSIKSSRSKRASIGTGLDRWRLFSRSTNALNDMNNPEDDNRPLGTLFADENTGSDSIDKKDSSPPNTTTSLTSRWKLPIRRTSSSAGAGAEGGFVVQSIRNVSRVQDTDYENRPPLDHHRSSSTSSVTLHRSTRSITAMSPLPAPVPDRQGSNGYGDVGMGPRPNLNIRTNSVPGASAWRDNTVEKAPSPTMISVEAFRNATRPSSRTGHRNASAISISSFEEINSPSERPRFEPTRSRRGSYQSLSSPNLDLGSAFGGFPRPAFATSGSASHSRTSTSSSMDPLPLAVSSNRPASMVLQPFGPDATTSSSALRSGSTSRLSISSFTTANEGGSLERRLSSNEDHVSAEHHARPASRPISRPASRPSSPTVFSIPQSSSTASDAELRLIAMYGAPSPTTTEFPSISLPDKASRTPFFLGDGPTSGEEDAGVHSGGPVHAFLTAGAHSPQTPLQNDGVRRFDEEGAAPTVAVQPPTPQVPVRRGQYQTRLASSSSAVETRSPSRLGASSARGRAAWGMASEKSDSEDEGDTSDNNGIRPEMSKSKAAPVSKILTSKSAPTPVLQRQEVDEDDEEDDNVPLAHIRSRSSTDLTHFYSSNPDSHSSGLHMNRGPVLADVEVLAELDDMPSETLRRSPASFAMRGHSRTFSAGATTTLASSAAIPAPTIARERTSLGQGQRSISDLSLSMLRPSPGSHTYSSPASPVPSKASVPDMNSMRASPPLPKTPIPRSFHGSAPWDSPSSRSFSSNTAGISSASSLAPAPCSSWFPPTTTSAMTSDTSPAISDPGTSQSQDTLVNSISSDQDRSRLTSRERSPIIVKFKDLPVLDGERDILLAPPPIKGYRKASGGRQVNHTLAPRFVPKPLPRSSSSLGFFHETPAGSGRGLEAAGATRTASRSSMIAPPSESEVLAGQTVFDRMKQRHRVEATKAIQLGKDLNGAVVQDEEDDDDEDDEAPLSTLPSRGPSGLNSRAFEIGGPTMFAPQSSYGGFSPLTNAPPGVDQSLYASLPNDQKMQLHQRSQQMMQMMAHAALQARAESVMNGAYSDSKSAVGGVRSTAVTEKSKSSKNPGSPSPQIQAYAALPPQSPYGYMTHSQSLTNLQSYPSSPMFSAPESPASPYLYANSLYPSSPNLTHAGYMPHHPLLPPSPQFWGGQPISPYVPQHPTPQQPMYAGSMMDYSSYASSAAASPRGQAGRTSSSSMIGVPSSTTQPRGVSAGMKGVRGNSASVIGGAGQR